MRPTFLASLKDFVCGLAIIVGGLIVGSTIIRAVVWFAAEMYLNTGV